jgi:hypothetical protein
LIEEDLIQVTTHPAQIDWSFRAVFVRELPGGGV